MYTITRTTRNNVLEFLTDLGWRSEEAIHFNRLEKLRFEKTEGSEKVRELKKSCRIKELARTIMLNY
jgi:hypothetical protein